MKAKQSRFIFSILRKSLYAEGITGWVFLESLRGTFAKLSRDTRPYEDRDIVAMRHPYAGVNQSWLQDKESRLINFQGVLQGRPVWQVSLDNTLVGKQDWVNPYIDWKAKDEFTSSLDKIRDKSMARLTVDARDLLAAPSWSKEDRVKWEGLLSRAVTREAAEIPAFKTYRTPAGSYGDLPYKGPISQIHAERLNDMAADIRDGTNKHTFNCETESVIKGALMQQIENALLPAGKRTQENMKVASNYFYGGGMVSNPALFNGTPVPHAYIVSSATGNITEATDRPGTGSPLLRNGLAPGLKPLFTQAATPAYRISDDPAWSFDRLVQGEIFTSKGRLYGRSADSAGGDSTLQEYGEARIKAGQFNPEKILERLSRLPPDADGPYKADVGILRKHGNEVLELRGLAEIYKDDPKKMKAIDRHMAQAESIYRDNVALLAGEGKLQAINSWLERQDFLSRLNNNINDPVSILRNIPQFPIR